jgi:hypothetical protein
MAACACGLVRVRNNSGRWTKSSDLTAHLKIFLSSGLIAFFICLLGLFLLLVTLLAPLGLLGLVRGVLWLWLHSGLQVNAEAQSQHLLDARAEGNLKTRACVSDEKCERKILQRANTHAQLSENVSVCKS